MPMHLSESEVQRRLEPAKLIAAIESAFRDRYESVTIPERVAAQMQNGVFLAMSCYDRGGHALGIKLVVVRDQAYAGDALHAGRVQATYLLLDPETAQPRLTIEANYLTDLRTAATSAVATKFMAREDAETLGIFGTGRLARSHLRVIPLARKFRQVLVCGRTPDRSAEFVRQHADDIPGIAIAAVDPRTCAAESDVLCTCTTSPTPLFDGRDLRPGTHLNLVGAFQPHTREADTETIRRAQIVIDSYGAAQSVGELQILLQERTISPDHVVSDLHELVSGKKEVRRTPEEITAFKSVGCALEDLVAAQLLA